MYGHRSLEAYCAQTEYFCKETYLANSESLEGGEEAEFSGSKKGEVTDLPLFTLPCFLFYFLFFFFYHVASVQPLKGAGR